MAGVTDNMTELVLLGKQKVALPLEFLEQWDVFSEVLSVTTWQTTLTEVQRQHLMKFLPTFPEKDKTEKEETLKLLFSEKNFKFGNPLKLFHGKIKDGYLCPDIARYRRMVQKAKINDYHVSQQQYYTKLLKQILLNRQRILEVIQYSPADHRLEVEWIPPPEVPKRMGLEAKVKAKYYSVLREVHDECGVDDTSSSDEEEKSVTRSRKQLFKSPSLENGSENGQSSVIPTFAPDPAGWGSGASAAITPKTEFSDEDYRNLLRQHRKRRLENPDSCELITAGLTLQDILFRTQPGAKHAKPPVSGGQQASSVNTSTTPPKVKSHKKKKKVKDMDTASTLAGSEKLSASQSGLFLDENARDGTEDAVMVPEIKQEVVTRNQSACFLSVLRDSICNIPESKATTHKVEESVMQWQNSGVDAWAAERSDWMQLVLPSLKFLSGDVLGLPLEDFIPLLDYKERAQQWVWIGQGRDSDEQLTVLCDLWLAQQDSLQAAGPIDGSASPQPPKIRTNFVVRPTTDEEKAIFRAQEKDRFDNPHKAFSYIMHGYQSVVGPVKGVYSKDNAMNKAREHALLVSDRPSYVTILTLVRDAAARLPNGEGTRSDICELLKDSSFLAPGVTDAQVNTVVSGALDRLHYEKDPCVKYEVNRKLWIYLHRNRTQEEFEKIHQAQGAAAKAKRALQKPKKKKVPTATLR